MPLSLSLHIQHLSDTLAMLHSMHLPFRLTPLPPLATPPPHTHARWSNRAQMFVELFQRWHLLVVNITPILGVIEVIAHEARFCVVAHQTLVVEAGASRSENTYR